MKELCSFKDVALQCSRNVFWGGAPPPHESPIAAFAFLFFNRAYFIKNEIFLLSSL